jgi:hypothetical protein
MKNSRLKLKIIFAFCTIVLISSFLVLSHSNAQTTPQFLVSWQAQSFVPGWYQGKIFPTYQSPLEINFELLISGKIVDLSKTKIRWYMNDKLVKNEDDGLGIKSLKITVPDYPGQETEIRISLPDYRGSVLDKIIKIPVARPEAMINVPYPDNQIKTGENYFQIFPFFFNVKKMDALSVEWSANGEKAASVTENPWQLTLNIDVATPSGFNINLSATVKNLLNQLEFNSQSIQLQLK